MIGRGALFSFALAAVTGYGMYQLTYDVVALEEDLAQRNRQILDRQEAIHVLKAEWAYLNEPGRLQRLADRHLDLQPLVGTHVVAMSALSTAGNAAPQVAVAPIKVPRLKPTPTGLGKRGAH
jgi:hypothetical protein